MAVASSSWSKFRHMAAHLHLWLQGHCLGHYHSASHLAHQHSATLLQLGKPQLPIQFTSARALQLLSPIYVPLPPIYAIFLPCTTALLVEELWLKSRPLEKSALRHAGGSGWWARWEAELQCPYGPNCGQAAKHPHCDHVTVGALTAVILGMSCKCIFFQHVFNFEQ